MRHNPIFWVIIITSIIETFFTGMGITFLLFLPSRIGYILNMMEFGLKVKTCLVWESMSVGWIILKALIFKSVFFNWKYFAIVLACSLIVLGTEFYDDSMWSYVSKDVDSDNTVDDNSLE